MDEILSWSARPPVYDIFVTTRTVQNPKAEVRKVHEHVRFLRYQISVSQKNMMSCKILFF